jgi:hypothetical protein
MARVDCAVAVAVAVAVAILFSSSRLLVPESLGMGVESS